VNRNFRGDAAGYPSGDPPKKTGLAFSPPDDFRRNESRIKDRPAIVRAAIYQTLESLGGPIRKTIIWHLNNRGLFPDNERIDIPSFYAGLRELVGPGADMIMVEAWDRLKRM